MTRKSDGTPRPARLGRAAGATRAMVLVGLVALAACDSNPMGPEALTPEPCVAPTEILAQAAPMPFAPMALQSALRHAAGPMTAALGVSAGANQLGARMMQLSLELDRGSVNAECRALNLAVSALQALPDNPATRPDRDGIRMILTLAARALAEELP